MRSSRVDRVHIGHCQSVRTKICRIFLEVGTLENRSMRNNNNKIMINFILNVMNKCSLSQALSIESVEKV